MAAKWKRNRFSRPERWKKLTVWRCPEGHTMETYEDLTHTMQYCNAWPESGKCRLLMVPDGD